MTDLSHHGVKGMKWGVHNAHPHYSSEMQHTDRKSFGKKGAQRINDHMHMGVTHDEAVQGEKDRRIIKRALITAYSGALAYKLAKKYGPALAAGIATTAAANRGRAAVPALGMWKPIVAKSARGVYKVTTL